MKSYTDLEQSKNLSEILPIESADMYYKYVLPTSKRIQRIPEIGNPINSLKLYNEGYTFSGKKKPITLNEYCIPCWSLDALMNLLPSEFTEVGKYSTTTYKIHIRKYRIREAYNGRNIWSSI